MYGVGTVAPTHVRIMVGNASLLPTLHGKNDSEDMNVRLSPGFFTGWDVLFYGGDISAGAFLF